MYSIFEDMWVLDVDAQESTIVLVDKNGGDSQILSLIVNNIQNKSVIFFSWLWIGTNV